MGYMRRKLTTEHDVCISIDTVGKQMTMNDSQRNRPNVVFIMVDQMKWSALRMYSEFGIPMPSLERLASRGVAFRHAFTPHPLCVPARTSVMTARYPHSTGCRRNETLMPAHETHAFNIWRDAGYTTGLIGKNHCFDLPEDLALFDVRCEMSHAGLPDGRAENFGMDWQRPVAAINRAHSERVNLRDNAQSPRIAYAVTDHPIEDYGTAVVTSQTEAFLERAISGDTFGRRDSKLSQGDDPAPFVLWVSYPDPHEPREAPKRYADMFPPDEVVLPPTRQGEFSDDGGVSSIDDAPYPPSGQVGTAPEVNRVLHRMMGLDDDAPEHVRGLISVHNAMCRFIDDGVGRILDKLEDLGVAEETIVVFTSDHGDFMGEHNMAVKGGVFYDCLTRVPLVVSYLAGIIPHGAVDDSMVNTIDILPTLLQLQGLASFDGLDVSWEGGRDEGSSNSSETTLGPNGTVRHHLLCRMHGKPLPTVTSAAPRDATFSEYGCGGPPVTMSHLDALDQPLGYRGLIDTLWAREAQGRRKMVRTREWKYVTDPIAAGAGTGATVDPEDELYDLANDPWELYNVARDPANASVVSEMRRILAQWMIETEGSEPVPLPATMGRA